MWCFACALVGGVVFERVSVSLVVGLRGANRFETESVDLELWAMSA